MNASSRAKSEGSPMARLYRLLDLTAVLRFTKRAEDMRVATDADDPASAHIASDARWKRRPCAKRFGMQFR
jgi:hypothetical protein